LYEVSAHIGQPALKDLNVAFDRFFKSIKGEGPKAGYPRFKRKGERDSARVYEVTLEERHLRMPNIGRVRLKESCREHGFEGRLLAATISRRADRWFVSLTVERERNVVLPQSPRKSSDFVEVDLGLANAAVIHDGSATRVVEPQRALRKTWRGCVGSIGSLLESGRDQRTARRRSSAARVSTTGSTVNGRTSVISSRVSSREPSG
jgi:putative transposase